MCWFVHANAARKHSQYSDAGGNTRCELATSYFTRPSTNRATKQLFNENTSLPLEYVHVSGDTANNAPANTPATLMGSPERFAVL